MADERIIVFDGVCVLCSRGLNFVLTHDKRELYKFAAMQTPAGHALLSAHGIDPHDPSSFLLIENGVAYADSEAVIRILRSFSGPWRLAGALRLVPPAIRDCAYRWLARNRYRWFGKLDQCTVPSPTTAGRFLH